jgi:hypothetical protein
MLVISGFKGSTERTETDPAGTAGTESGTSKERSNK